MSLSDREASSDRTDPIPSQSSLKCEGIMVNDLDHTAPGDPALDIMFHNISYANAFGGRWGGDLTGCEAAWQPAWDG